SAAAKTKPPSRIGTAPSNSPARHTDGPPLNPDSKPAMAPPSQDFTEVEELEEDESSVIDEPDAEGAFEKRKIFTDKSDPPVGSLHVAWKAGDLVLDPIFQRRKVWDDGRSS